MGPSAVQAAAMKTNRLGCGCILVLLLGIVVAMIVSGLLAR